MVVASLKLSLVFQFHCRTQRWKVLWLGRWCGVIHCGWFAHVNCYINVNWNLAELWHYRFNTTYYIITCLSHCCSVAAVRWGKCWCEINEINVLFCRTEKLTDEMKNALEKQNGFIYNTSRRTAYFFSCEALMDFLKRNDLSHVVRAHEVQHVGFKASLVISVQSNNLSV